MPYLSTMFNFCQQSNRSIPEKKDPPKLKRMSTGDSKNMEIAVAVWCLQCPPKIGSKIETSYLTLKIKLGDEASP